MNEVSANIADAQICLVRLADKHEGDIMAAAELNLEENDRKYPANRVMVSSKKYAECRDGGPGD